MKGLSRSIVSVFIFVLVAAPAVFANPSQDDEAAIQALIESWSAAAQAKDVEQFAAVYAEDAVVMLEGMPDLRGPEAIREGIGAMMQDPNFSLWFEPTGIVVAGSGDLAYETGPYRLSMSDAEGNRAEQEGHYVVVWRKRDGAWKVVIDAPVSDPAEAAH